MTTRQIEIGKRGAGPRIEQPRSQIRPNEAAAIAGAKAEAKGLPIRANPYRQTPSLRHAWNCGWQISHKDRDRA